MIQYIVCAMNFSNIANYGSDRLSEEEMGGIVKHEDH